MLVIFWDKSSFFTEQHIIIYVSYLLRQVFCNDTLQETASKCLQTCMSAHDCHYSWNGKSKSKGSRTLDRSVGSKLTQVSRPSACRWLGLHRISASANSKFGHFSQIRLRPYFWPNLADANATAVRSVSYLITDNKKLSYCWETVRRESMPRIAEMLVEMKT